MPDRNGDGLPLLTAVKDHRYRSQRQAAEVALSRLRPPAVRGEPKMTKSTPSPSPETSTKTEPAPGTSPLPNDGHVTAESASASQSPRKPKGLSHCIFECLVVEASAQAQDHLSVLADRYTERCRGVFDCAGDG